MCPIHHSESDQPRVNGGCVGVARMLVSSGPKKSSPAVGSIPGTATRFSDGRPSMNSLIAAPGMYGSRPIESDSRTTPGAPVASRPVYGWSSAAAKRTCAALPNWWNSLSRYGRTSGSVRNGRRSSARLPERTIAHR